MKHFQAVKEFAGSQFERAIIFEDDVILDPRFNEKFNTCLEESLAISEEHVVCLGNGCNLYTNRERRRHGKLLST